MKPSTEPKVSLSEVLSSLTYALDLTEGQPPGHSIRACLVGMRLADDLGLDSKTRSNLYYALLLKDAGCSMNASPVSRIFGSDDHTVKRALKVTDWTRYVDAAVYGIRNAAIGKGLWKRIVHVAKIAGSGNPGAREMVRIRCERGADIARQLGFPEETAAAIHALDEHWDGKGHPDGLRGEEIPLLARILLLSQTVDVFFHEAGHRGAIEMLRARRGTWFDPDLVDRVLAWVENADAFADHLSSAERTVADAEPSDRILHVDEAGLDRVSEAFADVVDAKSPYTFKHSSRVAGFARHLAEEHGLAPQRVRYVYRAGLLHDIGKLGVSNLILDKNGKLTDAEFREIQRHPVHSYEILSKVTAFKDIAWTAAVHHEKLDGSGYAWKVEAERLQLEDRILAVADVYEALTADRPYRAPMPAEEALGIMRRDAGRHLDGDVVERLARSIAGGFTL